MALSCGVQVGSEGADEDGGEEDTVAADQSATINVSLLQAYSRPLPGRILVDTTEDSRHRAGICEGFAG